MSHLRLRTQLLLASVILITAVVGATLLVVRQTVKAEVAQQVNAGLAGSVQTFQSVERQREIQLSRAAAMLAELPVLKAMMTTEHALTIQDASRQFWHLAGSDLFALGRNDGHILALHVSSPTLTMADADAAMVRSVRMNNQATWWYDDGRLYWVFLRPISSGDEAERHALGWIAVGYEVDETVAQELSRVAGSQILLSVGDRMIASTVNIDDATWHRLHSDPSILNATSEITLAGKQFQAASVVLEANAPTAVRCYVLLPLQQSTDFLLHLNRTLILLGIASVLLCALIFSFISGAITKPLENVVSAVRALAGGDYDYSVIPTGSSEVVHLGEAFATMRTRLLESQHRQIEAERLAALASTATSISHDLRHYLAALVANAEFLYEAETLSLDREEIYREIKLASDQMTDLIDSMRELSRDRGTISPSVARIDSVVQRAADAVRARHEFRSCEMSVQTSGDMEGVFDVRKLERVFFNLLLNACESRRDGEGRIIVSIHSEVDDFEIRVADNGNGIPDNIRNNVFDPFVSSGKPGGTGLGLAIVSKIVRDHGGRVEVERTTSQGTVMRVEMPRTVHPTESSPLPVGA
jgi:signal transduction histidine kinase